MAESTDNFLASINALIDSKMLDVNTSINGVIVSYANGLATVQPTGNKLFSDGDALPFPTIMNVPIRWPVFNGGLCGVKGPIVPGDRCIIVFSQQATDGSDDQRRFDLTDAYAIPCDANMAGQGANNADMIMYFGAASIALTAGGQMIVTAPGGTVFNAPTNQYTGSQTTQGLITGQGGFVIGGGSGATATVTGNVNINGTVTNNGKNIGSTHTHGGVQTGGGTTGVVS